MERTKLIAMQNNLGLGHKGDIILTTQNRVDNNLPMIAKDIIDAEHAEHLISCWNAFEDGGLVGELKDALQAWQEFVEKLTKIEPNLRFQVDVWHKYNTAKELTEALEKAEKLND